jgi:hypothetical protein
MHEYAFDNREVAGSRRIDGQLSRSKPPIMYIMSTQTEEKIEVGEVRLAGVSKPLSATSVT